MDRCMNDTIVLEYHYTYDAWGRPLTTTLSYNGEEAVTIEDNTYDALGRLSQTTRNSQSGLTTQYAYNIRDWVTQIASPVFVENLHYNTSNNGSTPQWGGNISAMAWQAPYSSAMGGGQAGALRSYNFVYDGMSRLLSAAYSEGGVNNNRYTTAYTYDPMGNILTLQRSGLLDDGEYGTLDNLNYEYEGNQLIKVDDSNIDEPTYVHAMHFTDGADEDVEYEYNANGSLVEDINKGLSIEYNVLNLPSTIYHYPAPVSSPETVKYVYAADGRKLHVEYYDNRILRPYPIYDGEGHVIGMEVPQKTPELMRDYCGDFIYEDGQLKRVLFDGGYITFDENSNNAPQYHFHVTDHLGNVRAVVNENNAIEELNHYYPYGSLFGESTGLSNSTQPYKYTGKELDRMHGLDLHDHGARWSDTNLGRWWKVDPKAEYFYDTSPYVLCGNNPLRYIDARGDSLTLKGNNEDLQATLSMINQGLGGYYTVDADGYGLVSISPVDGADSSNMTNSESAFFSIINKAVTGDGMATLNVVNESPDVFLGNISTFSIDIGDIQKIGNGAYFNSTSVIAHEIHEEYLVQAKRASIKSAHANASIKESQITGGYIAPNERLIENDQMNLIVRDTQNEKMIGKIKVIFLMAMSYA